MRYSWLGGIALLAASGIACPGPIGATDLLLLEKNLQAIIEKAEPSIASILVFRGQGNGARDTTLESDVTRTVPDRYGSGIVIDAQGLILTHYHVVREFTGDWSSENRIYIRVPGRRDSQGRMARPREGWATIHAADARSDLAVLRLRPNAGSANPIEFLTPGSGEKLKKGSFLVTLGHPYASGFRDGSPFASLGIVSNLRRHAPGSPREIERDRGLQFYGTLVQTDAKLQFGSSGAAVLDIEGQLVGLATSQAALEGVDQPGGFIIPLDANYRRIIEVLRRGEEVEYGFLGVSTQLEVWRNRLTDQDGVMIDGVILNSPADQAGLRRGDRIIRVNGSPIDNHDDLFLHLCASLAGKTCELVVQGMSDRVSRTVPVRLVKAPRSDRPFGRATRRPEPVHGLRVDYTSVIAQTGEPIAEGVLVREVAPNSPAKTAGLQEYQDVITAVNDIRVKTPAEFYREAQKVQDQGDKLRLALRQPSRTVTLP